MMGSTSRVGYVFLLFGLCAFLITSCVTEDAAPVPEEQPAVPAEEKAAPAEDVAPESAEEPEPEPKPEEEPPPEADEPEEELAPDREENPEETDESQQVQSQTEEFTVTQQVYTETFADIKDVIAELNAVIQSEDYDKWLSFVTPEYIRHFSDPEVLKKASNQPLLRKYNIRLRSLRDYFTYVVVPSRSNARLDEIVFQDETHVKAIMMIDGQRTILYQLEKKGEEWKIGI